MRFSFNPNRLAASIWSLIFVAAIATSTFGQVAKVEREVANKELPVTLANVVRQAPNRADEPIAKSYSITKATRFLDSASLRWQTQRRCFTCHTNFAYLYARPAIGANAPAHKEVRKFAEQLVGQRWKDKGPRWDAEVVAAAAALAFNDAATTKKLHALTRKALDRMWTLQRANGSWNWLKCDWPPMESDDHYGVTLAAIAVGVAPGDYVKSDAAKKGLSGIRTYLKKNAPPTIHHKAMMLWAGSYVDDIVTDQQRKTWTNALMALQKTDGGWALATLGNWKRGDKTQQDTKSSDGYGTGFAIYVLRRAGVPANDARIKKGIAWLKTNQRESGRWYTRSLFKDSKHYISHAGSAFAVMALGACDQLGE